MQDEYDYSFENRKDSGEPDASPSEKERSPQDTSSPLSGGADSSPFIDKSPSRTPDTPQPTPPIYDNGFQSPYWESRGSGTGGRPPRRQGSASKKVIAISALFVVLFVSSIMVFRGTGNSENGDKSSGGGTSPNDIFDSYDDNYGDYYDSFEDYFADYYDGAVSGVYSIPTVQADSSVSLQLAAAAEELTIQEVYVKLLPSVVGIMGGAEGTDLSWGSGIILSSDGYIITNAHVIDGCDSATVTLSDGREFDASLVGADTRSDIAVLKIEATGLSAAEFSDLSSMAVGDECVAIGNPLGEDFCGTMTNGIISAISRDVVYNGYSMTLLQTNTAINEGNSGGPLINMYGQVIGITNMKMVSYYSTIEGIGFAIPTTVVKTVVDELMGAGFVSGEPSLGITCGSISTTAAGYFTLPEGLYVSGVVEASDAYVKGVRIGDIITEANGEPITSTEEITAVKSGLEIGDSIEFTIYRDGETFTVEVMLMDRHELYGN